jgi:hypothetical protein
METLLIQQARRKRREATASLLRSIDTSFTTTPRQAQGSIDDSPRKSLYGRPGCDPVLRAIRSSVRGS